MRVVMALSALLLSAGLTQAAGPGPKGPCGEDIERLCKGGSEKTPDCLRRNEAKLSDGCRKGLVPTAAEAAKAPKAVKPPKSEGTCGADIDKFCGDQGKKIPECLRRSEAKLSAACREEMNKPFTPPSKPKGACGEYVQRFCKEDEAGKIDECLKQNESKVSPACKEEMHRPFAKTAKPAGACGAYVEKFCQGDRPLPIEICLRHNIKKVSAACKAEMDRRLDVPSR